MVTRITRKTRMASTIGMSICLVSAALVKPPALAVSITVFLNSAIALALSGEKASRLSLSVAVSDGMSLSPILMVATVPAGASTFLYGM